MLLLNKFKTFLFKIHPHIILLILFIFTILFSFGTVSYIFKEPFGTHTWRQTDSASFFYNYYNNGLNFFDFRILNLSMANGLAVSEFPIFYYLAALLSKLFGFNQWHLKFVNCFVYFLGIMSLYNVSFHFTKDKFWSIFISSLFFLSPVILYYGVNYIPDVTAFSLSIIGADYYFKSKEKPSKLVIAIIAFSLAGMLKPTYNLLLLSILSSEVIISKFNFFNLKKITAITAFALLFTLCWAKFAKNNNENNNSNYFLLETRSILNNDVDSATKEYIFKRTVDEWLPAFASKPVLWLLLLSLFILPFTFLNGNRYLTLAAFFSLLGSIIYYLLWYIQFLHHDYYSVVFYVLLFLSLLNAFKFLVEKIPLLSNNYFFKILAIFLLIYNLFYVKKDIHERLFGNKNDKRNTLFWDNNFKNYLKEIGLKNNDVVISIPDDSPQVSLYLLGYKGYTEFAEGEYSTEKVLYQKRKGAKYLIINDSAIYNFSKNEFLLIGKFNKAKIYKL